jgi:hypothetical protein
MRHRMSPPRRAERRAAPEPARIPTGERSTYSSDRRQCFTAAPECRLPDAKRSGQPPRAERRAAPKPARIPSGDRSTYSSDEGPTFPNLKTARIRKQCILGAPVCRFPDAKRSGQPPRAERRAAPKPARIPPGDRSTYSSNEGPT